MFDPNDKKAVKDISKEIIDTSHAISDRITIGDGYPIETITIEGDIELASDDGIAIDAPKKVKIITNNAKLVRQKKHLKKYKRQKSKYLLKEANKKAADWLKMVGYFDAEDLEAIDNNNDTNMNDLENTNTNNLN